MYEGYVPMTYSEYLKRMSKYFFNAVYHHSSFFSALYIFLLFYLPFYCVSDGEWGDHVTLQAAADLVYTCITLFVLLLHVIFYYFGVYFEHI